MRELPDDLFQLHPTNRGLALYGDKVYMATVDAGVVALDAKTGARWSGTCWLVTTPTATTRRWP